MDKVQLIAVAVRLFSISLAVFALRYVPGVISAFDLGSNMVGSYLWSATLVAFFMISFLLWKFPLTVAKNILPGDIKTENKSWNNDSFLSVGFIILGVYFLYYVISDSFYWLTVLIGSIKFGETMAPLDLDQWASIFTTVVELILSMFLIFRSRGIVKLIMKFRGR